jgi:hypothetical protein
MKLEQAYGIQAPFIVGILCFIPALLIFMPIMLFLLACCFCGDDEDGPSEGRTATAEGTTPPTKDGYSKVPTSDGDAPSSTNTSTQECKASEMVKIDMAD